MKHTLDSLIGAARRLEATLSSHVEGAARSFSPSRVRQPLEIVHAIVERVAQDIQPAGRGTFAFPFTTIRIALLASSPKDEARVRAVCEAPPSLRDRIVERLTAAGCTVPLLDVEIVFVPERQPDWIDPGFDIACSRVTSPPAPAPAAGLSLSVAAGTASSTTYTFTGEPITIGRGNEVRDAGHHVIRVNQVSFADSDGDDVNSTVSRQHARIEPDGPGGFRLFDDGSVQGTAVIRRGRVLPVSRGTRGVRLQSGDEILLGRARLHVTVV